MARRPSRIVVLVGVLAAIAGAPIVATAQVYSPKDCPNCAEWNAPHAPVKIHGNTFYVGTDGLSAILVTSPQGHVLLDAGLPESAALIMASIRGLGFRVEDVKLIVNSHAHYDHAGGIAAIARASGARVVASAPSAAMIRTGRSRRDDPQFGVALPYPGTPNVQLLKDGDTLRVGPIAIVAHSTPGHTPGGTSWSWRSCEGERCLELVYSDSQTPVTDDTFRYSGDARYPNAAADYARGFAILESLRCDIVITPHPSATSLWARLEGRATGKAPALVDPEGCRRYAAAARIKLTQRLTDERARPQRNP